MQEYSQEEQKRINELMKKYEGKETLELNRIKLAFQNSIAKDQYELNIKVINNIVNQREAWKRK
jgi:hypothetical protein